MGMIWFSWGVVRFTGAGRNDRGRRVSGGVKSEVCVGGYGFEADQTFVHLPVSVFLYFAFFEVLFRPTGYSIAYDSKEEPIEEEPLEEPNEEGYYRRFIANSSKVAKPLASLTQKIRKYEWAKEQEEAFQMLKDNLCDAPILSLPDGSKEFVVYCDASNQGFGCVLMQKGKSSVKDKILAALGKVSKVENVTAEMLRGMDQLMERKEGGGMYLLWVPLIGDVRTLMMDEAHASRYLVHSGADKTYYDLRDMYGGHVWRRILLPMLAIV
ncbi:putative reverse transcriptase domain-containing protein [Tanacetum coccineum]